MRKKPFRRGTMNKQIFRKLFYLSLILLNQTSLAASSYKSKQTPIDIRLYQALQNAQTKKIETIITSKEYSADNIGSNLWIPLFMDHQDKNPQWLYDQAALLVLNGINPQEGLVKLLFGGHSAFKTKPKLGATLAQMFIDNKADINELTEDATKSKTLIAIFVSNCKPHKTTDAMRAIKAVLEQQQKKEQKLQETENKRNQNEKTCSIQ